MLGRREEFREKAGLNVGAAVAQTEFSLHFRGNILLRYAGAIFHEPQTGPVHTRGKGEDSRFACALPAYHVVLAVKDEREDALAAYGGLRSLTAARAVIGGERRQSRRCKRRLRHVPDQSSSSR